MGYIWAFFNYCKTEKARRDFMDYVRAVMIIGATMAIVRVILDMVLQ